MHMRACMIISKTFNQHFFKTFLFIDCSIKQYFKKNDFSCWEYNSSKLHYYRIIVPLFHYYPKIDNTSQTIFIIMEQTMPEEEAFKLLKSAFHLSNNQLVYTGLNSHFLSIIFFLCKLTYTYYQFFIHLFYRFFIATAKFQLKSYWTV